MRIGQFEHKPGLLIAAFYLIFLAALLSLGSWQLHRAAQKKAILAASAVAQNAEAVLLTPQLDVTAAALAHTRVTFSGTYEESRQFLWDNRVHKGQAGFEVITPVKTEHGLVLVNRGWVAPGRTRQDLPNVAIAEALVGQSLDTTGLFSRPSKGLVSGDAFDNNSVWPRVLHFFDYEAIARELQQPVVAGVVQPQVAANKNNPVRADYLIPNWEPTAAVGPVRHYSYAFQWFAMAIALTVLYFVYNTRRVERH